jgi:hypothetical protein
MWYRLNETKSPKFLWPSLSNYSAIGGTHFFSNLYKHIRSTISVTFQYNIRVHHSPDLEPHRPVCFTHNCTVHSKPCKYSSYISTPWHGGPTLQHLSSAHAAILKIIYTPACSLSNNATMHLTRAHCQFIACPLRSIAWCNNSTMHVDLIGTLNWSTGGEEGRRPDKLTYAQRFTFNERILIWLS